MRTGDFYRRDDLNISKISRPKKLIEYKKREPESYYKSQDQQKREEHKKQRSDYFVCDWQQPVD